MSDLFATLAADPATAQAAMAGRAVADLPRAPHLPLVVVGAKGAGKSWLLQAVRERAEGGERPRQAELVSVGRLVELVQTKSNPEELHRVRTRLAEVDLLLLDDLDTAAKHLPAQALLHEILENRLVAGRSTVVSMSQAPDRLPALDPRIARRLMSGTVVTLGLPGADTRLALLRDRIRKSGTDLDDAVPAALAQLELRSLREYLGALNRILAFQQASAEPIGADDALILIGASVPATAGATASAAPGGATGAACRVAEAPAEPVIGVGDERPESEFDDFLSEVVANVSQQFDDWKGRVNEAIAHWRSRGVRTRRLEALLQEELAGDPEPAIADFGRDAAEVERLAREASLLAPDLAGAEVLKDPDQLAAARALVEEARARRAPLQAPLGHLTLEALGAGSSNRSALQAARAVLTEPGARYNPLVLVGPSGVGKTHLLHAIGNELASRGQSPVACVSGHSWLGEVAALRGADEAAIWRSRYQWLAALLIDDLHVLAGETRAQEELLQIFSALVDGGRPVIFASPRRLSDLAGFDPRLLSRLEAGLTAEIHPPDREVRLAVVKGLMAGTPAAADAALIDALAGRNAESIRSVQGAVQRVFGEAEGQGVVPSAALAREVLDAAGRVSRPARPPGGRPSGILSPGLGVARSREKMIVEWPRPAQRLLGELR
ncbi:MAG: DnaA/Hda family protein [Gemmatimonadales bacterium]